MQIFKATFLCGKMKRLFTLSLSNINVFYCVAYMYVIVAAILEVSDTKGEIKHLQDHLEDYATSLLKGREILILLEIKCKQTNI